MINDQCALVRAPLRLSINGRPHHITNEKLPLPLLLLVNALDWLIRQLHIALIAIIAYICTIHPDPL